MHRRNQLKILYLYCNFEYIRDRGKSLKYHEPLYGKNNIYIICIHTFSLKGIIDVVIYLCLIYKFTIYQPGLFVQSQPVTWNSMTILIAFVSLYVGIAFVIALRLIYFSPNLLTMMRM